MAWPMKRKTANFIVIKETITDSLHNEGTQDKAGCLQIAASKHIHRKLSRRKKVYYQKKKKNLNQR